VPAVWLALPVGREKNKAECGWYRQFFACGCSLGAARGDQVVATLAEEEAAALAIILVTDARHRN
jgi:hypothetical protein